MSAVCYEQHGDASVLRFHGDIPRPIQTPRQTLVRVEAAAVNPVDFKMRFHRIPEFVFPLPKIPGTDVAGVVMATDDESGFSVGDRVFGMMPLLGTPWGAYASYASIADRFLAKAPKTMDAVGAASLPLVALTVTQALTRALRHLQDRTTQQRILIQAGAGGVGSIAIQYCANVLGMRVATTCSSRNSDFVRSLGASVVIDYQSERFEQRVQDYDVVLDPLGHRYARRTLDSGVLRRGGHYIHIAGSDWPPEKASRVIPEATPAKAAVLLAKQCWSNFTTRLGIGGAFYHLVFVHPDGAALKDVARHVNEGKIQPVIDRVFPLSEAAAAHAYLEQGHARGKVVLRIE